MSEKPIQSGESTDRALIIGSEGASRATAFARFSDLDRCLGSCPATRQADSTGGRRSSSLDRDRHDELDMMLGLALILLAMIIVLTAAVPRPVGYLLAVSGLGFMIVGWLVATHGFTSGNTLPISVGYGFLVIAMIWVLVHSWRIKRSTTVESVVGASKGHFTRYG